MISYFYKAFLQLSTYLRAVFELFSRRKSLLYFFPCAFNIKLVNPLSLCDTQIMNCLARHKNLSLF